MMKSSKALLAVASHWPLAYSLAVLGFVIVQATRTSPGPRYFLLFDSPGMALVGLLFHMVCGFISLAVFVGYLVFVHSSGRVPLEKKLQWTILLLLGSVVTMTTGSWPGW